MSIHGPNDRIRNAIKQTVERLAKQSPPTVNSDVPAVGDLYVFDAGDDVALEWLVVRFHPDDSSLLLLAPADDFPLAGPPDIVLPETLVGRRLTIRCGETDWFPADFCESRLRVGAVPEQAISSVRQRLADLVRGRPVEPADRSADFDPEYEEWIGDVSRARSGLLVRSELPKTPRDDIILLSSLSSATPPSLAYAPEYSLAAEPGSTLFADLAQVIASADAVKYHEVQELAGGQLFLQVDTLGVRGVWEGSFESAPTLKGRDHSGDETDLGWRQGPKGRLHQSERFCPWVDGRASLIIETVPPRRLTIEQ
ncbi:hypothetical protein [Zavarzinella formosa]|uniref:hypothetical protein n=1 Tax=Zavarzinella formosa TaxID=360055 RepID=UPI0002F7C604|nr:hypothetical protein [Zavarzinella formosa]